MAMSRLTRWFQGLAGCMLAVALPATALAGAPTQAAAGPSCAHLRVALHTAPALADYSDVRQRAQTCGIPVETTTRPPICAHLLVAVGEAPGLRLYPGVAARLASCATSGADIFTDLVGYGWAQADITLLSSMGIIRGEGGQRFAPAGLLTRAQFAALMERMFHLQAPASPESFVDVQPGYWAYADIEAAAPYMSSFTVPGGTAFEPQLDATRIEVAATIGRIEVAENLAQLPSAQQAQALWAQFSDAAQVPPGLAQYGAVALQANLMRGYPDGSFGVSKSITRAEAAVLLARVLRATETMGGGTGTGGGPVAGWLVGEQPTAVTVGVYGSGGLTLSSYLLATGAQVALNGQAAALPNLPEGDAVSATLNAQGQVASVAASTPAATVVVGLFQGAGNGEATLSVGGTPEAVPLGPAPVVVDNEHTVNLGALGAGTQISVVEGVLGGSALIVAGQ